MKMLKIVPVLALAFLASACASGTPFGQRVFGGAAVGAGAGAVAGEIFGGAPGTGAAVGAGVGATAGALDWLYDEKNPRPQQQMPQQGFMSTATSAYPQCARYRDSEVLAACERGIERGAAAAHDANIRDAERRAEAQAYCAGRYDGRGCATAHQYSGGCGYCGTTRYSGAYGGSSYKPPIIIRYELRTGTRGPSNHSGSRSGSHRHR